LRERVEATLRLLGASPDLLSRRNLPLFEDATGLALAHVSRSGREHFLLPTAAVRWQRMRDAAAIESVVLVMISGFRSFAQQLELVRTRLAAGQPVDEVLTVLAPPGCSEHHTGEAADIGTPGSAPLSEAFEDTAAFRWLAANAGTFGFRMSYPRGNPMGYCYEPWHWRHTGTSAAYTEAD
jgi:D-alanyl-D-alanine carboxypeptidase